MHQLPPGAAQRIWIAIGIVAIGLVVLISATFGGRPSAMDQAKRQVGREMKLWDAPTRR